MPVSSVREVVRLPVLAVGLSMVSLILVKTGRDALFFTREGLDRLPLVMMGIALASLPAAMAHLEAIRRLGLRRARTGVLALVAVLFTAFVPVLGVHHRSTLLILFVLVPVAFAALFASVWLLAGELLEGASDEMIRWTYSRLGASSMAGGLLGGVLARILSLFFPPAFLIPSGGVVLLAVLALVVWTQGREGKPEMVFLAGQDPGHFRIPHSGNLFSTSLSLLSQRYVMGLVALSSLAALAALLVDFQFYARLKLSGNTQAGFFAGFYTLLNLAGLAVQLLVAPWVQSRFGVGGALMVLPLGLLGGATLLALSANFVTGSLLKVTENGLKSSIHRSSWEQAFLPLPSSYRGMVKTLADGLSARMAEGLGAAGLYFWLQSQRWSEAEVNLGWVTWAILATLLLWLLLTQYLVFLGCGQGPEREYWLRLPDG